jgi:hypothetical protein
MLTVNLDVTELVPFAFGNSTFTPLLTSVERMMKKMRSKNTKSVIDDMFPLTLTLLR